MLTTQLQGVIELLLRVCRFRDYRKPAILNMPFLGILEVTTSSVDRPQAAKR